MEVLEINEVRLFGLMAEGLLLDPIGYSRGEGSENPRMNRHQFFRRTKGCLQAIYRKNAA